MALVKKLTRIGNSWGIILPAELMKVTGIDENSSVELTVKDHTIELSPVSIKDQKVMKTFLGVLQDFDDTFKKLAK